MNEKNNIDGIQAIPVPSDIANSTSPTTPTVTDPQPTPPTVAPPARAQKKHKAPILPLLVVVLVAIFGFGAYKMLGAKDTKKAEKKVVTVVKKEIPLLRVISVDGEYTKDLYPPTYTSTNGTTAIRRQIFDSLVTLSEVKNLSPQIATSWTNPDTSTWVFKIRNDITFHNGTKLTAKSVKGSVDAAMAIPDYSTFLGTVKSVEATNDYTVTIKTKFPDGALLNKLTYISIYDPTAKVVDDMAGSGPYTVKKDTTRPATDSSKFTLQAITNYYGGTVYTKEVQFSQESDPVKIREAMIRGDYDIAPAGLNTDEIKLIVAAKPGTVVMEEEAVGTFGMYLNTIKPGPLQKLGVRQAIYNGLDYQKIVKASKTLSTVASQIVPSLIPGYNPSIKTPTRNITLAKKYLTDAGYPNGTTIELQSPQLNASLATEIKTQLAEIGITVTVTAPNVSTYFSDVNAGKFESWLVSYSTDINDSSDVISAVFQGTVYKNYYKSDKLDTIMKKANETFEINQRLKYLQEGTKVIMDDIPFIPIRNRTYQYVVTKPIEATLDYSLGTVFGVNYWKVYQK